jgi:hypothetical protein
MIKKVFLFFILILLIGTISGASNITREDALRCINDSQKIMKDLSLQKFNILRINDSLRQAENLYDSQVVLFDKKRSYDFSLVIPYCNEITKINKEAITAQDEFSAFKIFYNSSIIPGMNTSSIDLLVNQIQAEMDNERYENVKSMVDNAYNELINFKSSYTSLNLFLDSTTTGLRKFILKTWKVLLSIVIILIILFLIYRIKLSKWILTRQIENLQLRKKTVQELIMKVQKNYFETGKMPEGEYNIRIKKFAELIRDIDRQIPLLKEELIKLERTRIKKI